MIRSGHRRLARLFNLCYRCNIDDLIVFNNKKFLDYLKGIYPSQLTVQKLTNQITWQTTLISHSSQTVEVIFQPGFMTNVIILTSALSIFHSFPATYHLALTSGVYISQLIGYARGCSHYDDARYRYKCLVDRLFSQGYEALRLEKSFKKFYGRFQDVIEKYHKSVNVMVNDSFPG